MTPVDAVEGDVEEDGTGASFSAAAGCFLVNGSHDVKLLDFVDVFTVGGDAWALCAALWGATRPAWQPTP
ncbi:MAG TPA: hypothetical protein VHX49_04950 [Candidatus Acidoferrales bacterium]|nr:hypothetical protein [Candidatus Acidoferrales bacterium]